MIFLGVLNCIAFQALQSLYCLNTKSATWWNVTQVLTQALLWYALTHGTDASYGWNRVAMIVHTASGWPLLTASAFRCEMQYVVCINESEHEWIGYPCDWDIWDTLANVCLSCAEAYGKLVHFPQVPTVDIWTVQMCMSWHTSRPKSWRFEKTNVLDLPISMF